MALNVVIDTSPLENANAIRGVGMYTRLLCQYLSQIRGIKVLRKNELKATLSEQLSSIDVVHYPYFDLFFPTLPWRHTAPAVVTIHDLIPLVFPHYYSPGMRGWLKLLRQRLALSTTKAVITDSQASKQDIISFFHYPAHKIHVVYLAANPDLAPAKKDDISFIRSKYHLPATYILYVGDINYNKNIPQLIKSLKFLPDHIHLVCVGKNFYPQEIPEWKWIAAQIALSDVAHRVHFLTEVSAADVRELAALYSGALAYVQPSLYEGFGLPVLEAMQCQVPVVCTSTSSLLEVGGQHVVFTATDAEALAQGVKTVVAWSPTQRKKKILAAVQWCQKFSWQKTAHDTAAVYKLISRHSNTS